MTKNKKIQKLIQEIIEKLKTEYQPEKIILYGSYAYGKPTQDSDVDLFIIKETGKGHIERCVEVSKMIYEPVRRISIQPLVRTPSEVQERLDMGDDFIEEVLTRREILYAR